MAETSQIVHLYNRSMHGPSFRQSFSVLFIIFIGFLSATALQAWTGPTATAPGGNVAAPINVGTTDQVKNAGLSVNALAVFGGSYFSGNVGIGITNPSQKLVVTGNTWLSGNLVVQNGNLGLGTANPAYALTVTSGNKAIAVGEGNGSDTDGRLILGWTLASGGTPAWANISSYQGGYKLLDIEASPLVLNSNGNNVGIGTTNPTQRLDIGGGNIKMGRERVSSSCPGQTLCTATCTAGKQVIGGGCWIDSDFNTSIEFAPLADNSYSCETLNPNSPVTVYAICANMY